MKTLELNCPNCGATQHTVTPDGARDCLFCGTHYTVLATPPPALARPQAAPQPPAEWPPRVDPFNPEQVSPQHNDIAAIVVAIAVAIGGLMILALLFLLA